MRGERGGEWGEKGGEISLILESVGVNMWGVILILLIGSVHVAMETVYISQS